MLVGHPLVTVRGPGRVDDRTPQVSDRLVRFAKASPTAVHGDEGVLDNLLGLTAVTHQKRGQSHKSCVVPGVELGDSVVGAPALRRPPGRTPRGPPPPQ